jgi:hypothetical protein
MLVFISQSRGIEPSSNPAQPRPAFPSPTLFTHIPLTAAMLLQRDMITSEGHKLAKLDDFPDNSPGALALEKLKLKTFPAGRAKKPRL